MSVKELVFDQLVKNLAVIISVGILAKESVSTMDKFSKNRAGGSRAKSEYEHLSNCSQQQEDIEITKTSFTLGRPKFSGFLDTLFFFVLLNERKLMRPSLGRLEVIFDGGQASKADQSRG